MNIIINGITNSDFDDFEAGLEQMNLEDSVYFKLRDMNINYCQGCWDCWVKTPGICSIKDDYEQILSKIPSAERITIITPIIAGYESSLIKKFKDRLIPMVHPYVEIYKGEQHHLQRYAKNPDFRVIVLEDEYTTEEDIVTIKDLYERTSLNLRYKLIGVESIKKGDELQNVIDDI